LCRLVIRVFPGYRRGGVQYIRRPARYDVIGLESPDFTCVQNIVAIFIAAGITGCPGVLIAHVDAGYRYCAVIRDRKIERSRITQNTVCGFTVLLTAMLGGTAAVVVCAVGAAVVAVVVVVVVVRVVDAVVAAVITGCLLLWLSW